MTLKNGDIIGIGSEPSWSEQILGWYQEGDFDVEVAAKLEIPIKEFYRQMETNAAFGRLVEYGRTLCESYWVGMARKLVKNKGMNAQPWVFVMKNKFNWADKSEQVGEGNTNANLDELKQSLSREVSRFMQQYQPELQDAERALKLVGSDD